MKVQTNLLQIYRAIGWTKEAKMDLGSRRKSAKILRDLYKFEIFQKVQQLSLVIVKPSESLNRL